MSNVRPRADRQLVSAQADILRNAKVSNMKVKFEPQPCAADVAPQFSAWMAARVGPVNGDFELVEAGVAFAIFCFIPLCQITAGHAAVDVFANSFSARVNRVLRMITEIVFALVLVLIAWRLGAGTVSKFENGETSFLLEFPVWWAYGLSLVAAIVAAIVGVYMAVIRSIEAITGQIRIWDGVEVQS